MFLQILQNAQETLAPDSLFNESAELQPETYQKRGLDTEVFLVSFTIFNKINLILKTSGELPLCEICIFFCNFG